MDRSRSCRLLEILTIAGALFWLPVLSIASETPPALIVSIKSLNRFLGGLEKIPHARELFERTPLAQHLAVFDREGAWSLCVFIDPQQPDHPGLLVSIPIKDMQELTRLVQSYNFVSLRPGNGDAWVFQLPAKRVEARYLNHALHVATNPADLSQVEAQQGALAELLRDFDLALRLQSQGIPEVWRQAAAARFDEEFAAARRELQSGETLPRRLRVQVLALVNEAVQRVASGTDRIDAGLRIGEGLEIDAHWVALANSPLAADFAQLTLPGNDWSSGWQTEASAVTLAVRLPAWMQEKLQESARLLREKATAELASQAAGLNPQQALGLMDALQASLDGGELRGWLGFVPGSDQKMSFLGLLSVARADRLRAGLEEFLPVIARSPHVAAVEEGSVTGESIEVHRIRRAQLRPREERLYGGEAAAYLGTVRDMFAFAIGSSACEDLLRDAPARTGGGARLAEFRWSSRPWVEVVEAERLLQVFPDGADDALVVTVTAEERSLRCQVRAESGYLRLLGLALERW